MARIIYTLHAAWVFASQDGSGVHSPEPSGTVIVEGRVCGAPERSTSSKLALLQVSGQRHSALCKVLSVSRKITS